MTIKNLEILYQDKYLVAINKPSGLLVHRSPIARHETEFVIQILHHQLNQFVYPIHRLDKPTSGVLLLALNPDIAKELSKQWSNTHKYYQAVCRGLAPEYTVIDHPITTKLEPGDRFISPKTQPAQTIITREHARSLNVGFGRQAKHYPHTTFSLVNAELVTGRKHQIRKHLKHINHPIVGDTQYGKGDINRYFRRHYQIYRLMLHCHLLIFKHPIGNQFIEIHATVDATWQYLLTSLFNISDSYL
ncbi:MAG: pseudouridylate synthase [Cardiobacteriales bacterium]|nr:MAG: pseudouridylate synthase [Cardiobacteriales bacterium]